MSTKLILTHDVTNLGVAGDVVTVKDGYARNYLVPPQAGHPVDQGRSASDRPDGRGSPPQRH